MIGSQYVSDPERWRVFYEDLLGGKIDTKQYRPNQKGGRRRPYVIPVSRVTPMKAVENRAKVELRDAMQEGDPHVSLQKSEKGVTSPRVISLPPKRKWDDNGSTSSEKSKIPKTEKQSTQTRIPNRKRLLPRYRFNL
ncbi:hypothetical protein BOW28_11660 [Solemya velum gill symbiont]|nr:hypothetical protein BOW00_12355 [Solemya velum gill symbiont]OOZ15575.1 hypothetical protein BOW28_11660 [Solemya velum gill symbiont]